MFLGVSTGIHYILTTIAHNAPRPTDVRSVDVRHFPAAEENEAYEDHTDVVQEVGISRKISRGDGLGDTQFSKVYSRLDIYGYSGVLNVHCPVDRIHYISTIHLMFYQI